MPMYGKLGVATVEPQPRWSVFSQFEVGMLKLASEYGTTCTHQQLAIAIKEAMLEIEKDPLAFNTQPNGRRRSCKARAKEYVHIKYALDAIVSHRQRVATAE